MEVLRCTLILFLVTCYAMLSRVQGSGSLYDPPNRAVMWKYGFYTGKNYNYMQLNCGGEKGLELKVEILQSNVYEVSGGVGIKSLDQEVAGSSPTKVTTATSQKTPVLVFPGRGLESDSQPENGPFKCGICGDPFDQKREHEKGGKYGSMTISRYYPASVKEMSVKIELLAFEKGFFEFRICAANNNTVTQECLDDNILPIKEGYLAGTPLRFYPKGAGDFRLTVAVPPNLACERCVLQWRYHTANSWGTDPVTNKQGLGFGPQEEFRNCADIRIGGAVPDSVRNNPFFAPPDERSASSIDRPTEQRKKLASNNKTLVISPNGADRFSPAIRTLLNGLQKKVTSHTGDFTSGSSHITSGQVEGKLDKRNQNIMMIPDVSSSGGSILNVRAATGEKRKSSRMNLMPTVSDAVGDHQRSIDTRIAQSNSFSNDQTTNNQNGGFRSDNVLYNQQNGQQNASMGTIKISDFRAESGSLLSGATNSIGNQMIGDQMSGGVNSIGDQMVIDQMSGGVNSIGDQMSGEFNSMDSHLISEQMSSKVNSIGDKMVRDQMSGGVGFSGSLDNIMNDGSSSFGNIGSLMVGGSDITGVIANKKNAGSTLSGEVDRQNIAGTTHTGDIMNQKGGSTFSGGMDTQIAGGTAYIENIGSPFTGGINSPITLERDLTRGVGVQMTGEMAITGGTENLMNDRSGLGKSIDNILTGKSQDIFSAEMGSKVSGRVVGKSGGGMVNGQMSMETQKTTGKINRQKKGNIDEQTISGIISKQFSPSTHLQVGQGNMKQHGGLTSKDIDINAGMVGMGDQNSQVGSILTSGTDESRKGATDLIRKVQDLIGMSAGRSVDNVKVYQTLPTRQDINVPSETNAATIDTTGMVGPAPKPSKKVSISVEGASIANTDSGVATGNMRAATRSGFALTGERTGFGSIGNDVQPPDIQRPRVFVDPSKQTIKQGVVTDTNLDISAGFGILTNFEPKSTSQASGKTDTAASSGTNTLAFSDMYIPDLTMDGTQINTITDKINTNLDIRSPVENINTNKNLKQQIGADFTRNLDINNSPGGLVTDTGKIIANERVSAIETGLITHKKIADKQQVEAAFTGIKPDNGSGGFEPVPSVSALRPNSGRQRIFLVRASRPQTVLLSSSAEGSNRGMMISESIQPSAEKRIVSSTDQAGLKNTNAETMSLTDAANAKVTGTGMKDVSPSVDSSIMIEPLVNSLNPLEKSSMLLDSSLANMATSEVIDPLRTQTLRSDGVIVGENQFLPSGQTDVFAGKSVDTVPDNTNKGLGGSVVNEINAFRNELVKSSLRQGGAVTADKATSETTPLKSKTAAQDSKAKQVTKDSVLGGTSLVLSNEIGGKSESTGLDQTVSDLLNEAKRMLGTSMDFTSLPTANTEGAAGSPSKEPIIDLTPSIQRDPFASSFPVISESVLGSKEPISHTQMDGHAGAIDNIVATGGIDNVVAKGSDSPFLGNVGIHKPTTEILNIDDLIGGPSNVQDINGIRTVALTPTETMTNVAPETLRNSGTIAVVMGGSTPTSGANVDVGRSQIGTDQSAKQSFNIISTVDYIGTGVPNVIDQSMQFGTVGTSASTEGGTNLISGRTESKVGTQDLLRLATMTNPLENIMNSNSMADTHGGAAITHTIPGATITDTPGGNAMVGSMMFDTPADVGGGAKSGTRVNSALIGIHDGITITGPHSGSAVSVTHDGSPMTGRGGGNVIVDSRRDSAVTGIHSGGVMAGTRDGNAMTGRSGGSVTVDSLRDNAMTGTHSGSLFTDSHGGSAISGSGTLADTLRDGTVIGTLDGSTLVDSPSGVSGTFGENSVTGTLHGSTVSGPAVLYRGGIFLPDSALTGPHASRTVEMGPSIDTSPSNRLGGNVIDLSSSPRRPRPPISASSIRQRQISGGVQQADQQPIPSPMLAIGNDNSLQGGSGFDLSMGSDLAGKSSNMGRVNSVSASSERIDSTVSVQRQRNLTRSGRRTIGGNNRVTNARRPTAAPPRRRNNRKDTVNIEQQINSFSFQDIPSSPVIGGGIQMSGDGSMTAGFGPRGEMPGGMLNERRVMSREDRRRGEVRGSSRRRNVDRSRDMLTDVMDPRTGFEEMIPAGRRLGERGQRDMRVSRIERVIVRGRDGPSGTGSGRIGPEYFLDMSGGSPESGRTVIGGRRRDGGTDSSRGRVVEIRDIRVRPGRRGASFDVGMGGPRSTTERRSGDFGADSVRIERDFRGGRMGDRSEGRSLSLIEGDRSDRRRSLRPMVGPAVLPPPGPMSSGGGFSTGMSPFRGSFPMMSPGPVMGGPMGGLPFDAGLGPGFGPGIGPGFGPGMGMSGGIPPFSPMGFGPGIF